MFRTVVVLAFFLGCTFMSAQLDDYKYIIVPKKFVAFKDINQYQSSTMIKFYMEKAGFNVVYDDNLPDDVAANRCLALFTDIQDNSSMFTTKLAIVLNDCKGQMVYTTPEFKTKVKEYTKAYKGLITEASSTFMGVTQNYVPKSRDKAVEETKEELQASGAKTQLSLENDREVASVKAEETAIDTTASIPKNDSGVQSLAAIATKEGYLLVDNDDTILYRLTETAAKNVFLADKKGIKGIVYKKEGKWYFESEKNSNKTVRELNIRF